MYYAPLISEGSTSIKVYPRTNILDLANNLTQRNLLKYPKTFIFIAESKGVAKKLRFGEFAIKSGMSAMDLLKNIVAGTGLVIHKITFVEGWTFEDVKKSLASNPDLKQTLANQDDAAIMKTLGYPEKNPEGLFFPDTYLFTWTTPDTVILKKSYNKMKKFLTDHIKNEKTITPCQNSYQALIIASMIEKETASDEEKPIIAGIIFRRMQKGMRLQIDPTVTYGLKKPYGTTITRSDLKTITPYNTYQIYGLPPAPISMPGASSILAALQPDMKQNYLYYVSRGDGTHTFSDTYEQHLQAVKKFQALSKDNKN